MSTSIQVNFISSLETSFLICRHGFSYYWSIDPVAGSTVFRSSYVLFTASAFELYFYPCKCNTRIQ